MVMDKITIKGAREHNLNNISIEIPKNQLVVFTGVSGSGKSSLAFDTIFAEGQRRYIESLSTYARQFLGQMNKPDVDYINGLTPAVSIDQKSTSNNPRSTVGTAGFAAPGPAAVPDAPLPERFPATELRHPRILDGSACGAPAPGISACHAGPHFHGVRRMFSRSRSGRRGLRARSDCGSEDRLIIRDSESLHGDRSV